MPLRKNPSPGCHEIYNFVKKVFELSGYSIVLSCQELHVDPFLFIWYYTFTEFGPKTGEPPVKCAIGLVYVVKM